jgi:hypothetical protein
MCNERRKCLGVQDPDISPLVVCGRFDPPSGQDDDTLHRIASPGSIEEQVPEPVADRASLYNGMAIRFDPVDE